jgi:hypothetical protein
MAYPKGKPKSEESKAKAREKCLAFWTDDKKLERSNNYNGELNPFYGKHHTIETKDNLALINTGKKLNDETKEKISLSLIGNDRAKGNKFNLSEEQKEHLSKIKIGENNPAWKGGITPENTKIRNSKKYSDWRISVFERDAYTCQHCHVIGGKLQADHIKPFALYPEERFSVENGRTLCVECHKKTDTYGYNKKDAQVI